MTPEKCKDCDMRESCETAPQIEELEAQFRKVFNQHANLAPALFALERVFIWLTLGLNAEARQSFVDWLMSTADTVAALDELESMPEDSPKQ